MSQAKPEQEREAWTSVSVPLASCGNQAGLDPAFSSSHECNEEATYRRGVSLMSLGFLGVFGGFQAAQGLQTSLNATLGGLNLTCLYGTFTLLCLVAPPLLSGLEKVLGMRLLLLLCSLPYVAMALSNVIPMPAEPSSMWAVPMAMNVLVGVTAPLLWTSQNAYLSRCATHAAAVQAESAEALGHWRSTMTTRYNSLFFSIYMFSGLAGNVIASLILIALGDSQTAKNVLFVTLSLMSLCGALIFLAMPVVPDASASDAMQPSLSDTGHLAFTDAKTGLMIPLMVTNGMCLAAFFGDFQTDVTCPVAGPEYSGFVIATFFGVNSFVSFAWGKIIPGFMSRRTAYILTSGLIGVYLVVKLLWKAPQNWVLPEGSTTWERKEATGFGDICTIFALAAVFAGGDSFFEAGPPMTLQTFYAGTDKVVAAMANYKLWQSLGFAVQFFIGVALKDHPQVRGGLLLALLGLSLLCVMILDRCVASVDSGTSGRAIGGLTETPSSTA